MAVHLPPRRSRWRALAFTLVSSFWLGSAMPTAVSAQGQNPAPRWHPPYCGQQPRINSVYDNDQPLYQANGNVRLFSGHDVLPCGLGYDGHSGVDYARSPSLQGCGGGMRPGIRGHFVYATETGIVRRARWYAPDHETGYGLHVELDHDDATHGRLSSLYGHLAVIYVEEGELVYEGMLIGAAGSTGNSTGPHLHYQTVRGERGDVSNLSFDPFGWNAVFGPGYRYPGFPQPHRGNAWPMRVIQPGEEGVPCRGSCQTEIVDDDDPSVIFGCNAGLGLAACPDWHESPIGGDGGHHWTFPNGTQKDYWVRYSCPICHSGTFFVDAYIPYGAHIANAHVARYRAIGASATFSSSAVVDQHEEGHIWQPLGKFDFPGIPTIELSDRSDLQDYVDAAPHKLAADAIRFRRVCMDDGTDPPMIPNQASEEVLQ